VEKYDLPLKLLSDNKGEVTAKYDVKSWLPGRSARAVVVIDKNGKIAYRKVESLSIFRPKDDSVLAAIRKAG
jgi:peroxiredoxin